MNCCPLRVYDFFRPIELLLKMIKNYILLYEEARLSVREIIHVMKLKKNVKHGHLPFFQRDIHNLYVKMTKVHAVNDAMDILQFCKERNEFLQFCKERNEFYVSICIYNR